MNDRDDIPASAKWIADFIQRIGFPIFIACAIAAYHVWYVNKSQANSERISEALNKNTEAVTALRHFLTHKYDE